MNDGKFQPFERLGAKATTPEARSRDLHSKLSAGGLTDAERDELVVLDAELTEKHGRAGAWLAKPDLRSYAIGHHPAVLDIDSGWSRDAVSIDIRTSRGKTVSLTVAQWRELASAVEQIIEHCERQRFEAQEGE